MPIEIEEFEAGANGEERSTAEKIVEFLLENRDAAFTRGEIAAAINRKANTVGTNLSRLKERELVRHSGKHWAITDDSDRLSHAIRFSESLSQLDGQYGSILNSEEDARAWSNAQPDQDHPSEPADEDDSNQLDALEESSD